MRKIITIIVLWFLPSMAYSLTGQEVYELLSQRSKEIKKFPFHVYIMPDYSDFQGISLPLSSYAFFARAYKPLQTAVLPEWLFATFHFSQGTRWKCFLLRVPGMYDVENIDLWIYDTLKKTWQRPMKIAEGWGDAGYSIHTQAWIEDLNKDGWFDVVIRTLETDFDLEGPNGAEIVKWKNSIFLWSKDRFKDASPDYLQRMKIEKYQLKGYRYENEE